MSCCSVVIDSLGKIHYGCEDGYTNKIPSVKFPQKFYTAKNGDKILLVGTVRAGHKFIIDYNLANGELDKIAKEEWWRGKASDGSLEDDNWECSAIIIKITGEILLVEGPFENYEISKPGYASIGSGGDVARAILWDKLSGKKNVSSNEAKKVLYRAIEASCSVGIDGCSLPITIETLEV